MKKMGRLYILMLNIFIAMLGFGLIVPVMPSYIEAFGATGKHSVFLSLQQVLHNLRYRRLPGH